MPSNHLLSWIVFLPLLGIPLLALLPKERAAAVRWTAFGVSLLPLAAALAMYFRFDPAGAAFQQVEDRAWFTLGGAEIRYLLGVDGISLFLVLLTAFLTPLAIAASRSVEKHLRAFLICLLVMETGILGVFLALDFILFYVFWELVLIPMALVIGVWGSANRVYAMVKFFIYTMAGSLLMLVGILVLAGLHYDATGVHTFAYPTIAEAVQGTLGIPLAIPFDRQVLLFLAFGVAFAIKIPLFPFHTWLPDAHTEAPTAGSVILAGVLLKMGAYGFLRFCLPLFPEAALRLAPWICALALVGIVYGALVAMVQPDLKRLVAYSSVSHMGYVVLGIFTFSFTGMQGANLQMLNHGISTGMLFLLVGMLYDRRHTREIEAFGGLAKTMPVFAVFFLIATLSSLGLPGLNGFVGEILVLAGTFLENRVFAAVAAAGMILSAVYLLRAYQRVFFGPVTHEENRAVLDLGWRERLILVPLVLLMVWIGVASGFFLRPTDVSVQRTLKPVAQAKTWSLPPEPLARADARPTFFRAVLRPGPPLPSLPDKK